MKKEKPVVCEYCRGTGWTEHYDYRYGGATVTASCNLCNTSIARQKAARRKRRRKK